MALVDRDPSVEQYFHDIEKSSALSSAEESAVSQRIQKGDEQAIAVLVQANLRFVITIAKKYENHGLPLNDLIWGIHLTGVRRDPHQCSAADRHGRFAPGRSRLVGCPRRLGGSGGSFLGRRLAMRSWKRIGSWATASSSPR